MKWRGAERWGQQSDSKAHDDAVRQIDHELGSQICHERERQHGCEGGAEQPAFDARMKSSIHLFISGQCRLGAVDRFFIDRQIDQSRKHAQCNRNYPDRVVVALSGI